jgi:L-threonylcarbamoyladenylate synthase
MILAGGDCEIGLESTIVKLDGDHLTLLGPGAITPEMLQEVFPSVTVDDCSQRPIGENEKPAAPGMKYRHYAPRAKVVVLDGDESSVLSYQIAAAKNESNGILCCEDHVEKIGGKHVFSLGMNPADMAKKLFASLREFGAIPEVETIYAVMPPNDGIGSAVRNRLMKAAGFTVIKL